MRASSGMASRGEPVRVAAAVPALVVVAHGVRRLAQAGHLPDDRLAAGHVGLQLRPVVAEQRLVVQQDAVRQRLFTTWCATTCRARPGRGRAVPRAAPENRTCRKRCLAQGSAVLKQRELEAKYFAQAEGTPR